MAKGHGRFMVVNVGGELVKGTTSDFNEGADEHDVTEYGDNGHVVSGGLTKGSFSIEGIYDNTAVTGPRAVLKPLIGTVVEIERRPDGTGSGKAQDTFNALLTNYNESAPVADMIKWKADFTMSGTVDDAAQPA